MDNKKITVIFGIMSAILFIVIILGVGAVLKKDKNKDIAENRTTEQQDEITNAELIREEHTEVETETEEETTELTTEATTEATTEVVAEVTTEVLTVADDKEPPIFLSLAKSCEIKQGNAFDLQKYIGYADDVDRDPVLNVEGTVDTSVLGSYPLTLTLTDAAGRVTTASMTVKVVTEYTPGSGTKSTMDFETFKVNYKNESTVLGIDVSRWQEDVDFTQVKNAGCDFVIIRIGGYDDGSLYEDRYFKNNIKNAKAAGLQVGIYWHAEEGNAEEVKNSVAYMMQILGGEQLDFPIVYDWEDFANFQNYNMNLHDINNCFEAFYNEVKTYGYDACLYSSKNFLINVWTNPNEHPVWLAHYTSRTDYMGKYFMWQQGCTGRIPGINGDVDFDIWYKN